MLQSLRAAGSRPALIHAQSGRVCTYAELAERSRRLAIGLRARGVGPGDRVAMLCLNRFEIIETLLACAHLGAALVPLNWRLSAAELVAIVRDAAPRALLYDPPCRTAAGVIAGAVPIAVMAALEPDDAPGAIQDDRQGASEPDGRGARPDDRQGDIQDSAASGPLAIARPYAELLAADSASPAGLAAQADPSAIAMILYTSGTTGTAKGAMLTWRQVEFNARVTTELCGLVAADRCLACLPMFHTGGLNCLAMPLLYAGGSVVIMSKLEPAAAIAAIARHDITAIIAVPTIYAMLLDAGLSAGAVPSLRWLLMGGAPCPEPLFAAYERIGYPLSQGYGLTEVGPNCFTLAIGAPRGTVGVPMPGTEARLIDDHGATLTGNAQGELCLRGPHVTAGYWNQPELTAQVLDADGWFHTGDVAHRDAAGFYAIVGRKKDMYISGGENVYPAEVELVLAAHPAVAEVAVVGVPDARWGEVGLAVIVPRTVAQGGDALAGELERYCRARLAAYKVPRQWRFVSELPRTPTGKVAKHRLR